MPQQPFDDLMAVVNERIQEDVVSRLGPESGNDVVEDTEPKAPVAPPQQDSAALAGILSIPGVQDLILASRRGEKMVVLPETEYKTSRQPVQAPAPQAPEPEPDWENLPPEKMAQTLQRKITGSVLSGLSEILKESVRPLAEKIDGLTSRNEAEERQKVQSDVEDVLKRHPDLPQYKDLMIQLKAENPGLTVEELYELAKKRSGHMDVSVTEVERPTQIAARPSGRPPRTGPVNSRRNLSDAIERAIGRMGKSSLLVER